MLESSPHAGYSCIYTNKPCLAVHFRDADEELPERYDIPLIVHRYPRLLALGMLLIDIGRTTCVKEDSPRGQTREARVNRDYTMGQRISNSDPDWSKLGHTDDAREQLGTIYRTAT